MINHWAVLVCAVFNMLLGAAWYSPFVLPEYLKQENITDGRGHSESQPMKMYGIGFLLVYLMSYNLAFFLGDAGTDWQWGTMAGFLAGFGWAAGHFTSIALFEQKSWRYILINGGYIIIYFTVIGFILGYGGEKPPGAKDEANFFLQALRLSEAILPEPITSADGEDILDFEFGENLHPIYFSSTTGHKKRTPENEY